jgi:mono/diheme cytochrome c family protein
MLDGFRRLAVAFAVTIILAPCSSLLAETETSAPPQNPTPDKSDPGQVSPGNGKVVISKQAQAEADDVFETRCVACHGDEGRGDGPAAANLNPGPRDFHDAKWQKSVSDATLARAIVEGGQAVGASSEMAANPDLENEPDVVAALIERIRGWSK